MTTYPNQIKKAFFQDTEITGNIISVGNDGKYSYDYSTVQAGISAAADGDLVLLYPGSYTDATIIYLADGETIYIRGMGGTAEDTKINAKISTLNFNGAELAVMENFAIYKQTGYRMYEALQLWNGDLATRIYLNHMYLAPNAFYGWNDNCIAYYNEFGTAYDFQGKSFVSFSKLDRLISSGKHHIQNTISPQNQSWEKIELDSSYYGGPKDPSPLDYVITPTSGYGYGYGDSLITFTTYASVTTTNTVTSSEDAFFVDSGLEYESSEIAISGATQADPVVITATAHGYSDGDSIWIQDVKGMTELNYKKYKIKNKTTNTFELTDENDVNIDGTGYGAYTSGGICQKYVSTISGLNHLEGETVAVLGDGKVLDNQIVTSGTITLSSAATNVKVGLPYNTDLETLRVDFGSKDTLQHRMKRIPELTIRLYETFSCKAGPDSDNLDSLEFDSDDNNLKSSQPAVFTGDKSIRPEDSYNYDGQILIRQDEPGPLTVIAIIPDVEIY